jgi:hypothetical protein
MPDEHEGAAARPLSDQVEASLAAVWARFAGDRPVGSSIELGGNVIRLTVPSGTEQFERGMARDDDDADAPPRTAARYEREAAQAVSKVMRRKVDAMISKHDAKTGIATEVFILEQLPRKY